MRSISSAAVLFLTFPLPVALTIILTSHAYITDRLGFKIRLNPDRPATATDFIVFEPDQGMAPRETFFSLKQANANAATAIANGQATVIAVPVATPVAAKPY
eukprot:TRINITY_DN9317_c0_g1_i5.p3 TRINITY_DN9317_c0_g1~~TRINITY_DN9317_c0_g1_i5.p3  ORF type:complete len:102 (+),score=25.29 TRINITY_DN9317_c0_g1_i5:739-1044(+)